MSERKQHRKIQHFIPSISEVYIFAIQCPTALGAVIQEGGVIFEADGEAEGEFGARVDVAEEDVCDCVAGFVAAVPLDELLAESELLQEM